MASLYETLNGGWRLQFVDAAEKRHGLYIGKCNGRQAERIAAKIDDLIAAQRYGGQPADETNAWLQGISAKLHNRLVKAGLVMPRAEAKSHTLGELLARFTATMAGKPGTALAYGHVVRNLADHFGDDKALDAIQPGDADDFKAWLNKEQHLSTATVARRCVAARTIFRRGVRWALLTGNPFDGLRCGGSFNEERKVFVPLADVMKVMEVCPHMDWKVLLMLSRIGGLRIPSEALPLTWDCVDWDKGTLLVKSPKTEHHEGQASRFVPLFPELRAVLLEAFEKAEPGTPWIITRYRDSNANLRQHFERLILRAGLTPWAKPWHNMRASRQSELMAEYDLATACRWLGNSPTVAARHYAVSTDRDGSFQRAIGQAAETSGAKSGAASPCTDGHRRTRSV